MSAPPIQLLEWDSAHYGMPVGNITGSIDTPDSLDAALASAQAQGIRLAFWLSSDAFAPNPRSLRLYGGQRIVGYRRYARPINNVDRDQASDPRCESAVGAAPDQALIDLAVQAGRCSRFHLDKRLPDGRFEAMYETWIVRSLSGELADDVLVIRDTHDRIQSLVTYRTSKAAVQIGLVCTTEAAQGAGCATTLLSEVHQRIGRSGMRKVVVATQPENHAACSLYEKSGYSVDLAGSYYHFLMS